MAASRRVGRYGRSTSGSSYSVLRPYQLTMSVRSEADRAKGWAAGGAVIATARSRASRSRSQTENRSVWCASR